MNYGISLLFASICFGVYAQELESLRVSKTFSLLRPITVTLHQGSKDLSQVTFKRNTDTLFGKNKPLDYDLEGEEILITAVFTTMDNPILQKSSRRISKMETYSPNDLYGKQLVIDLEECGTISGDLCLKFKLEPVKKSSKQPWMDVGKKVHMDIPIALGRKNVSQELKVQVLKNDKSVYSQAVLTKAQEKTPPEKKIKLPILKTATVGQAEKDLQDYIIRTYDADNREITTGIVFLLKLFGKKDAKMGSLAIIINENNRPEFVQKQLLALYPL